jgi:hypothetical protein
MSDTTGLREEAARIFASMVAEKREADEWQRVRDAEIAAGNHRQAERVAAGLPFVPPSPDATPDPLGRSPGVAAVAMVERIESVLEYLEEHRDPPLTPAQLAVLYDTAAEYGGLLNLFKSEGHDIREQWTRADALFTQIADLTGRSPA